MNRTFHFLCLTDEKIKSAEPVQDSAFQLYKVNPWLCSISPECICECVHVYVHISNMCGHTNMCAYVCMTHGLCRNLRFITFHSYQVRKSNLKLLICLVLPAACSGNRLSTLWGRRHRWAAVTTPHLHDSGMQTLVLTGLPPQHPCILDDCPTRPFLGERIIVPQGCCFTNTTLNIVYILGQIVAEGLLVGVERKCAE